MKIIFDSGLEMVIPKGKEQFIALTVMELLGAKDGSTVTGLRPRAIETKPREKYKTKGGYHWRVWTESDDQEILKLKSYGLNAPQISKKVNRTTQAVYVRLSVLRKRVADGSSGEVDTPLLDRINRVTAESQE